MRNLLLLALIAFHTLPALAGDNSCLQKMMEAAVNRQLPWPDQVLKSAGVSADKVATLKVKTEDFERGYNDTRESLNMLEYDLSLVASPEVVLYQRLEIYPLPANANALFKFKITSFAQRSDFSRPLQVVEQGTSAADCTSKSTSSVTEYIPNPGNRFWTTIKNSKVELSVPTEDLLRNFASDSVDSVAKLITLINQNPPLRIWNNDGEWTATLTAKSEPTRRRYNPNADRIELESAAWLVHMVFDQLGSNLEVRWSTGSSGDRLVEIHDSSGGSLIYEYVRKDLWLKAKFPRRHGTYWTWTMGFNNTDFYADRLTYHVDADALWQPYKNYARYYQMVNAGNRLGDLQFDAVATRPTEPPHALLWLGTEVSGGPDLDSTMNVNLDDVKAIADEMRPSLVGKNRLQVARTIIRKLPELIAYDSEAADNGQVGQSSLKQILQTKKGVCQHFAALFQGISRSLGIPARVIMGSYLGTNEAPGHAWVEVKLDDQTWWPLDPQIDRDSLPSLNYFPWGVDFIYTAHDQQEYDAEAKKWAESHALFYSFRKVSAEGADAMSRLMRMLGL